MSTRNIFLLNPKWTGASFLTALALSLWWWILSVCPVCLAGDWRETNSSILNISWSHYEQLGRLDTGVSADLDGLRRVTVGHWFHHIDFGIWADGFRSGEENIGRFRLEKGVYKDFRIGGVFGTDDYLLSFIGWQITPHARLYLNYEWKGEDFSVSGYVNPWSWCSASMKGDHLDNWRVTSGLTLRFFTGNRYTPRKSTAKKHIDWQN